ncbi:phosphate/phosphite/phosphonate ABC transporter substrate-binding protein [Shimia ponticola]|uniref:phosphate/phosphite/phosphonate ABC transporter substrate-binding protein n=1 Tax=Shimia ponticola TaxID=2582893 RepID=UPI0011BEB636|nr:PhnD/SsuA/transferrin family substrate-binding protein [Shimia ponticola]
MIASLPMYDAPGQQAANDRLWTLIRDALPFEAPESLTRGADLWDMWTSDDLLLSQTCGLPYRMSLYDRTNLLGVPDQRLPHASAGNYYSVIIARNPDQSIENATLAYNEGRSQSGWAFVAEMNTNPSLCTGSHAASAAAVRDGVADIAAIDASTWRFLRASDPTLADLVEIARTEVSPTLPFITNMADHVSDLVEALTKAFSALSPEDADTLGMYGLKQIQAADYLELPIPAPPQF